MKTGNRHRPSFLSHGSIQIPVTSLAAAVLLHLVLEAPLLSSAYFISNIMSQYECITSLFSNFVFKNLLPQLMAFLCNFLAHSGVVAVLY
jgi:hypothetical protein